MEKRETNLMEKCPCLNERTEDINSPEKGMFKCIKGAKWLLLVPGALMILAFVLGYLLDPVTVRLLWLITSGFIIVIGATFYILINIWVKKLQKVDSQ